jgi:hypothetical protein
MLGRGLRGDLANHRVDVVIATKGGLGLDEEHGLVRDSSPEWLRRGAETATGPALALGLSAPEAAVRFPAIGGDQIAGGS